VVTSALGQRVVTALLLAAVVVCVLMLLEPVVALPVIACVFLAAAWEWAGFGGQAEKIERAVYVVAIAATIGILWGMTQSADALRHLLVWTAGWWLAAMLWLWLGPRRGGPRAALLAGFLVLAPAAVALARLVLIEPHGRELLLFLVVLVAAADVGAYFGGRRFGRHKLAPFVSPGKTWEGLVCGLAAAAGIAIIGALVFAMPWATWLILCLAVAAISVIGDLVESMFKRRAGLKDSGNLLPGHGGVLDRIDSLTAAGPIFLLALYSAGLAS
jgi:phosphatidate cytidylyltransferase